jgi:hypothetical protein
MKTPAKKKKQGPVACIYRENAAGEEEEIEVEIDAEWARSDPSCGAAGGVAVYQMAVRTDNGERIELTKAEVERIEEEELERVCDEEDRARYDAAEHKWEVMNDR